MSQFQHLLEGIVDEDEAYETGEALLGEAGEVLDQEAGIGGHQEQAEERRPQADPQAELQIIKVVVPARSSTTKQVLPVSGNLVWFYAALPTKV